MDVFCGWIINIGVLKITGTPDLAESRASRGGAIPQQKAQNPKIAHFQGRRLIFCMQGSFWLG